MKNNDKIKLDILSNIDDDIVERNSIKRFELFGRILEKKPNRKMMLAWISAAACFCIMFGVIAALILVGIKQVPVYTGMTVSSSIEQSTAVAETETDSRTTEIERLAYELTRLSYTCGVLANNGNAFGKYKNENLTDDSVTSETAEETDSLSVQGSNQIYYAKPNSDIYITVHIDNPDSFEILSFTLNGNKYSSYMFEQGSDMENLILKVNIGDVEGIVEYTIDAIKYVDGTDIKDVRMEGDRVVRIGVESEKLPFAKIEKEEIGFEEIKFDIKITDELSLIKMLGVTVQAQLYDANGIVETKDVELDGGEIKFEKLEVNTAYRCVIVAQYDALTGVGLESYVLYEHSFKTKAPVEFNDTAEVTQTAVSFSFAKAEEFADTKIERIELWHNGEMVKELSADATGVDGLLSDNEYTVKAYYTYKNDTKEITKTFRTQAKAVPKVEISDVEKTASSVTYSLTVTDIDNICNVKDIYITDVSGTKLNITATDNCFAGLNPATVYLICGEYEYDLNDGAGTRAGWIYEKLVITDIDVELMAASCSSDSIQTGSTITLQFKLSDIGNAVINGIRISGQSLKVTDIGNNYYSVKYIPDIKSGIYSPKIEKIYYSTPVLKSETEFSIDMGISIKVFGNVEVTSVSLDNGKTYAECGESAVGYIELTGAEGHTVNSMKLSTNHLIVLNKISDTRYSFEVPSSSSAMAYKITSLTYSLGGESKTKALDDIYAFYRFDTSNIIEIRTPEELQNMSKDGHYKLMNDIDMRNFDWTPIAEFNGYLDGNGYKIKNLMIDRYATTWGDSDFSWSMFVQMNGVLHNVEVTGLSIFCSVDNAHELCGGDGDMDIYVAGLVGDIYEYGVDDGILLNCHVSGDIIVDINAADHTVCVYVGGLGAAGTDYGTVTNDHKIYESCSFEGAISITYTEDGYFSYGNKVVTSGIGDGLKINCSVNASCIVNHAARELEA